jgi:hypothetical protein
VNRPILTGRFLAVQPGESGGLRWLDAGTELPEWADGQVGEHLLEGYVAPAVSEEAGTMEVLVTADTEGVRELVAELTAQRDEAVAEAKSLRELLADLTDPDTAGPSDPPGPDLEPPPRGGPGSSTEEWAKYAGLLGVKVGPGANRDDIIRDLEEAGKPT